MQEKKAANTNSYGNILASCRDLPSGVLRHSLSGGKYCCAMAKWLLPLIACFLAAVMPAIAQTVTVTRQTCADLVEQVPDADVEYKPGVDVNGDAVAPADLPGTPQIIVPQEFSIPITVNLGKRLGIPSTPNNFKAEAQIGVVTYKNGKAYFNGQPLQDPEAEALSKLCQQVMKRN